MSGGYAGAGPLIYDGAEAYGHAEDAREVYTSLKSYAADGVITAYSAPGRDFPCTTGNTNVIYTDADSSSTVTANDHWTITNSSCYDALTGQTLNGTVRYNITAKEGGNPFRTSTAWTASVTAITDYTLTYANGSTQGVFTYNRTIAHNITVGTDNSLVVSATPSRYSLSYVPVPAPSGSSTLPAYSYSSLTGTVYYSGSILDNSTYKKYGALVLTGRDDIINLPGGSNFVIGIYAPTTLTGTFSNGTTHLAPTGGSFQILAGNNSAAISSAPFTARTIIYADTSVPYTGTNTDFAAALTP
ncbi:MAG: hypothetical protein QM533_02710 [Cytophagales bacterium]|nr:hypothetical protein [Cytophagales bacterium]